MKTKQIEARLKHLGTVLADQKVKVMIGQGVANGFPAMSSKIGEIFIDPTCPKEPDKIRNLIASKGKLYHELCHVMLTTHENEHQYNAAKTNNRNAYLAVANIIEDGRIERATVKQFQGMKPYFDYLLSYFPSNGEPLADLVIYVRTGIWTKGGKGQSFFAKHAKLIDKVLDAPNSLPVWKAALKIVADLFQGVTVGNESTCYTKPSGGKMTKPEPKPESKESSEDNQDRYELSDDDCPEDSEAGSDSGEDSEGEDSEGGSSGGDSEDDSGESSDGDEDGEDSEAGQTDGSSGKGNGSRIIGEPKPKTGEELREQIARELAVEIEGEIEDMKEAELIGKLASRREGQALADALEVSEASSLASILKQLDAQAKRTDYAPSLRSGRIDSRRISNIVTNGTFLKRRAPVHDKRPAVVILLDTSHSMVDDFGESTRAQVAFRAARIINAAVKDANLFAQVLEYDYSPISIDSVSLTANTSGGSTYTAKALRSADRILKDRPEPRKLVILITDGTTGDSEDYPQVKAELEKHQIFVAGVIVNDKTDAQMHGGNAVQKELIAVCDLTINAEANLSHQLAALIRDFTR